MTTKHTPGVASWTPGPWQSSVPPSSCLTIRNVETENGIIIAKIGHKDSSMGDIAEHVANARLIAAAPELLEACQRLIAHCPDPENKVYPLGLHEIRIAVAQATGHPTEGIRTML